MTRRLFCGATGALAAPVAPTAASREHMVSGPWPESRLAGVLLPREKFTPFPTIGERGAWEAVPSDIREAALAAGRENSGAAWTDLPATLFLEYTRNGNRSRFQSASFGRRRRLASLAIAECLEAKGRFLDEIANGVWAISEESFWGIPAGFPNREGLPDVTDPVVELFTGETAALLAWVDYLLGPTLDKVSPVLRRRIRVETDRRMLSPCLARDFGWMGLAFQRPGEQLEPVDLLQLADRGAAARGRRAAPPRGCAQGHALPGSLHRRICRRWRLRRGPQLLASRRRVAVRLPGTAAAGLGWSHRLLRHPAGARNRPLYLSRPHCRPMVREFRRCVAEIHSHAGLGLSLRARHSRRADDRLRRLGRHAQAHRAGKHRQDPAGAVARRRTPQDARPAAPGSRRLAERNPGDGGAMQGGIATGPLHRREGRPQRRKPQPQRPRQLHRLCRRRTRDHRRRRGKLHGQDIQRATIRNLDHAVRVP